MNTLEKMARALYESLDAQGYAGIYQLEGDTSLSGEFDLEKVARAALKAMRNPSYEVQDIMHQRCRDDKLWVAGAVWNAMIDAVLEGR